MTGSILPAKREKGGGCGGVGRWCFDVDDTTSFCLVYFFCFFTSISRVQICRKHCKRSESTCWKGLPSDFSLSVLLLFSSCKCGQSYFLWQAHFISAARSDVIALQMPAKKVGANALRETLEKGQSELQGGGGGLSDCYWKQTCAHGSVFFSLALSPCLRCTFRRRHSSKKPCGGLLRRGGMCLQTLRLYSSSWD